MEITKPSHTYAGYHEIDDVLADLIQKCLFCGKEFETETKTIQCSGKEYSGDYETYAVHLAQIDVYLLKLTSASGMVEVESEINKLFSKRKENLERILSKCNLDDYLVKATRQEGLQHEDSLLKKTKSNLVDIIPEQSGYIGWMDSDSVDYCPKEFKCHKSCLPDKDIFVVEELMKATLLKDYFAIKIKQTPTEYKKIIPLFKREQIKFAHQDYDPFNPRWKS